MFKRAIVVLAGIALTVAGLTLLSRPSSNPVDGHSVAALGESNAPEGGDTTVQGKATPLGADPTPSSSPTSSNPTPTLDPAFTASPIPTGPPRSDPTWTPLLSEHFDGTDLDPTIWRTYGETSEWPGHAGHGLRVARSVTVENGTAVITAREVNNVIESGGFTVRSPYYLTYGKVEARLRVEPDPSGVMSAVALTWPTDNDQCADGENDFYETLRQRADFNSFIHPGCHSQVSFSHAHDPTAWHTVAMEWEPDRLAIIVDGSLEGEWTDPAVIAHGLHRLTFQYDARADDMGTVVTKMYIDDVKIWTLNR
jgi:beta-glucanase (GH16 family)